MKSIQLIVLIITISILTSSCTNKSSHKFIVEYNENDIQICTNSGGPKHTEPLYTIEETLSLGGEEPEPKLFQPYGILVDDQGCIYCIDEQRIKKFSPEGEFIDYLSRPGQGPGEVSYPSFNTIVADTLYIGQNRWSGWRKFELLNTSGEFIARVPFPRLKIEPKTGLRKTTVGPLRNSRFLFYVQDPLTEDRNTNYEWTFGIADLNGNIIKMLELDIEPFTGWIERDGRGTVAPFVVGAESTIGESIYILSGVGGRIDQFSQVGDLERVIKLDLPREPVTAADVAKVLEGRSRPGREQFLVRSDFPELMPLCSALIVDDEKRLWLKKGATDFSYHLETTTYLLISAEGEYLTDQTFPCEIEVVRNGMAYGYVIHDDGVRVLKRFRLVN